MSASASTSAGEEDSRGGKKSEKKKKKGRSREEEGTEGGSRRGRRSGDGNGDKGSTRNRHPTVRGVEEEGGDGGRASSLTDSDATDGGGWNRRADASSFLLPRPLPPPKESRNGSRRIIDIEREVGILGRRRATPRGWADDLVR